MEGMDIKRVTVDGREWEIYTFDGEKGTIILARLTRLVLGPLGAAMGGINGTESLGDMSLDKAFVKLAENMEERTILETLKELMTCVRTGEGMPINFKEDFRGRTSTMLKLAKEVLEVNYRDFFELVKDALGARSKSKTRLKGTSQA